MSRQDKKHRREQKRKAKRHEVRRKQSGSPVKRLVDAPGDVECWMSKDFEGMGQRQIFAFKRAAGLSGIFCFLLDRGVVGLKDAWARIGVTRDDLLDFIDQAQSGGIQMRSVRPDEGRKWVAAAARWAHENGMRLPREWMKIAGVLGDVSDWQSADVSAFTKEFVGHPEDLRQRVVGESFDDYVKRDDVEIVFSTDAPYMDQQTGEYLQADQIDELDEDELDALDEALDDELPVEEVNAIADRLTPAAQQLALQTAEWLKAHQDMPSEELFEAWRSMMMAAMMSKSAMPDAPDEEVGDFGYEMLKSLSGRVEPSHAEEYDRAVGQALRHLETDNLMMQKAVLKYGLAGEVLGDAGDEGD